MEVDADEEEEDAAVSLVKDVAGPGGRVLAVAIVQRSCGDVDALVRVLEAGRDTLLLGLCNPKVQWVCMVSADIRKRMRSDGSEVSYPPALC